MSLAINLTALTSIALVILLNESIAAPLNGFTFQYAEFLPNVHEGVMAARTFVATELTPGLPMPEAILRVEQAHAACEEPASPTAVVKCEYSILARPSEGDLGENIWTVSLVPGQDDTLLSASVERHHVGMSGPE